MLGCDSAQCIGQTLRGERLGYGAWFEYTDVRDRLHGLVGADASRVRSRAIGLRSDGFDETGKLYEGKR
jgi:hypothetical protein